MTVKGLLKRNLNINYSDKLILRKKKLNEVKKYKAFDKIMRSIKSAEFVHYNACHNLITNFIINYPTSDGGYLLLKQLNCKFNVNECKEQITFKNN